MIWLLISILASSTAEEQALRIQFRAIWTAVDHYVAEHGSPPLALTDLESASERGPLERVPRDPWGTPVVWLRPERRGDAGCLSSAGPDRRHGTLDDIRSRCEPGELNPFLLAEAGRQPYPVLDAYGRMIRVIRRRASTLAWSLGPDGEADTPDDLVAQIRSGD